MSVTLTMDQFADLYNTATMKLPNDKTGILICSFKESDTRYKATFDVAGMMHPVLIEIR